VDAEIQLISLLKCGENLVEISACGGFCSRCNKCERLVEVTVVLKNALFAVNKLGALQQHIPRVFFDG
jgi:hypothetical protein